MFLQKCKLIFLKVQTNLQTLGVKTSTFMFSHLRANNGRCEKRCSSYFHTCAKTKEGVKNMFSHFCWNNGGLKNDPFHVFRTSVKTIEGGKKCAVCLSQIPVGLAFEKMTKWLSSNACATSATSTKCYC